jgi:hypothetical protein
MDIEINIFTPMLPTRPCKYCLSLQGDSVFADFDIVHEIVCLVRISFDGYGCCGIPEPDRKMNERDSRKFIEMLESGNIVQAEMSEILTRYFQENSDVIWEDALTDHGLL